MRLIDCAVAILVIFGWPSPMQAETLNAFYQGTQVSIYVGAEAGGGFDSYARLIARHLGTHIPGHPTVVVHNMPGAGSLAMMNYIADVAPQDGTAIGAAQSSAPLERLLHLGSPGGKAAHFDATKLNWIGSAASDVFVLFGRSDGKVKSLQDLMTTEFVLGTSNLNTDGALIATTLNKILGTKIKIVTGYQSSAAIVLAVERGEIDGAALAYSSISTMRPEWIKDKKVVLFLQCAIRPDPALSGVPFVLDRVPSLDDQQIMKLIFAKFQIGRPYFVGPNVPLDRVAGLQAAFDETMRDAELLAEAQQSRLEVSPMTGLEVLALINNLYGTNPSLVAQAREILGKQ